MKRISRNQPCPINSSICITSPVCQKCKHYISHTNVDDEHGRIEYYLMDCKVLNFKADIDMLFKRNEPSYHEIMFVVTRNGKKIMVDLDPILYENEVCDPDETDMEEIVDSCSYKQIPDKPGLYHAKLRLHSFQSNNPDDPVEYDFSSTLEEIFYVGNLKDL